MDNLLQGMMGNFSDEIVGAVAKQAGVNPEMAQMVLEKMAPAMTGAMAKNAETKEGAQSLADALDSKHDGSIFGNLGSMMGGGLEQDGAKILGHVFGNKTEQVEQVLEQETGADKASTMKMMTTFAPLILGALGQQKKSQGLDVGSLAGMLGGAASAMSGDKSKSSLLRTVMDLDRDGKIIDDIPKVLGFLGIAKKFFGRK